MTNRTFKFLGVFLSVSEKTPWELKVAERSTKFSPEKKKTNGDCFRWVLIKFKKRHITPITLEDIMQALFCF